MDGVLQVFLPKNPKYRKLKNVNYLICDLANKKRFTKKLIKILIML